MKAIQFDDYGPPEVLYEAEIDTPVAGSGQLLLRTVAAGVNPVDYKWRQGMFRAFVPLPLPYVPGVDVAGIVTGVGEGVSGFRIGDRVAAFVADGCYAEYVAVDAAACALVPDSIDLTAAAALPCITLTGVQLVEEAVRPQAGQTVLITGATGGVGRFAVHATLELGARVIAAVRPAYADEARDLGVHQIIALEGGSAEDLRFDHVADTVGGPAVASLCRHLAPGGRIGTVATTHMDPASLPATPVAHRCHPDGARLARVLDAVARGAVVMPSVRRMPFNTDAAAEAHRQVEAGGLGGKIVLET